MNEEKVYLDDKEFYICYNRKKKNQIYFGFLNPSEDDSSLITFSFLVNRNEWDNLLNFLKSTKSHKGEKIYKGFDIAKNKPLLYKPNSLKAISHFGKIGIFTDTDMREERKSLIFMRKRHLYDFISIEKNGISANLGKSKYIRFRKFIIDNTHRVK